MLRGDAALVDNRGYHDIWRARCISTVHRTWVTLNHVVHSTVCELEKNDLNNMIETARPRPLGSPAAPRPGPHWSLHTPTHVTRHTLILPGCIILMHTPHTDTVETHPRARRGRPQAAPGHTRAQPQSHTVHRSQRCTPLVNRAHTRKIDIDYHGTALVFVLKCWTFENSEILYSIL